MSGVIDKLFDQSLSGISKSLDLYHRRNEALTSNVANAETPQYRATDITFAGELNSAFKKTSHQSLKMTNSKHMDIQSSSKAHLVADNSGATKADGNNVDLDIQMGKMVLNAGKYATSASLVRKKLQMMRMAIRQAMMR